jgi:3-oxoacyl-[acyl-carrier-protein] synthase II
MPSSELAPIRRVVITGVGAMSPFGVGARVFWESALAGRSGVRPITHFDTTGYTSTIAGMVPDFDSSAWVAKRDSNRMDRFTVLAVAAAKEALDDAGIVLKDRGGELEGHFLPENADPDRFGCFIGSGIGGIETFEEQHSRLLSKGPKRVSPFTIPKLMANSASGEVSIVCGLGGPNESIVTACASATHSIGEALHVIRRGVADVMLAGGSEASVTPLGVAGFCSLKALSVRNDEPQRASRPFDKDRDGFVMAEGAACLVIEELGHALKRGARIYAELLGFGASADAYHITQPCPDGAGAVRAMKAAIADAGVPADRIDYVNAHGTSTLYNDRVETLAIKKALGEEWAHKIAVSSTKSMIGHSLGAAGGFGLIAAALSIHEGVVHPTINYENRDPDCDLDYVPEGARKMKIRAALVNSLGFGGHNGSLVAGAYAADGA